MNFYVGIHQPSDAQHFDRAFISVNRLRDRRSSFVVDEWIMDSGAFSELVTHGQYRHDPSEYAAEINRWHGCGNMLAAVSQDYMCEPGIILKTGLSVREHQTRTIQRYLSITAATPHYVMPVLQGYKLDDYLSHIEQYRGLLQPQAWVGVGSVCKRNGDPAQIEDILREIKRARPDLRLHGFGLKTTALANATICDLLYSADSMAWSYAARKQGRNANDWREAKAFEEGIQARHKQISLPIFQ